MAGGEFITISVDGAKAVEKSLLNLEIKVGRKIVRTALRNGAKIVHKTAKANALANVGGELGPKIAKSLKVRAMTRMNLSNVGVKVQIDPKANDEFVYVTKDGNRYYIPNAVEFGHAFPGRGGGENPPKDVAADPYMRPAFDTEKDKVARRIENDIKNGILLAAK